MAAACEPQTRVFRRICPSTARSNFEEEKYPHPKNRRKSNEDIWGAPAAAFSANALPRERSLFAIVHPEQLNKVVAGSKIRTK